MTLPSTLLDAARRLVCPARRLVCPHEWRTERRLDYTPAGRVVVIAQHECQRCGRSTRHTHYPERVDAEVAG